MLIFPAGMAAAAAKGAATIGGTVAASIGGGVASYYIIKGVNGDEQPQIYHAIVASASETKLDFLHGFNFGQAESSLVLLTMIIVAIFILYKCGNTCRYRCCKKNKFSHKHLDRMAIANMAKIIGQNMGGTRAMKLKQKPEEAVNAFAGNETEEPVEITKPNTINKVSSPPKKNQRR